MFLNALSNENKNTSKSTNSSMETIIGSGTEINGDINFNGTGVLRIDGRVTGKITAEQSKIIVGEEAFIDAEIVTQNIVINGEVQGNIKVTQTMELLPTARLIGDVRVKGLKISEGAIFKGTCDMLGLSEDSTSSFTTTVNKSENETNDDNKNQNDSNKKDSKKLF
ncbi:MAG: polymer-forming cytoskeletal protein [Clostridia bacterium]